MWMDPSRRVCPMGEREQMMLRAFLAGSPGDTLIICRMRGKQCVGMAKHGDDCFACARVTLAHDTTFNDVLALAPAFHS